VLYMLKGEWKGSYAYTHAVFLPGAQMPAPDSPVATLRPACRSRIQKIRHCYYKITGNRSLLKDIKLNTYILKAYCLIG